MFALSARIQTLLRGHKYALFIFQRADFGYGTKVLFKVEVIRGRKRLCFAYSEVISAIIEINYPLYVYFQSDKLVKKLGIGAYTRTLLARCSLQFVWDFVPIRVVW